MTWQSGFVFVAIWLSCVGAPPITSLRYQWLKAIAAPRVTFRNTRALIAVCTTHPPTFPPKSSRLQRNMVIFQNYTHNFSAKLPPDLLQVIYQARGVKRSEFLQLPRGPRADRTVRLQKKMSKSLPGVYAASTPKMSASLSTLVNFLHPPSPWKKSVREKKKNI